MAFDDPEAIRELFSPFGSVSVRRMFGGHGVFADGMMFALEQDGELFLKADDLTIPKLAAENSEPFVYRARGREIALSYWKLPERLYDEADEFAAFIGFNERLLTGIWVGYDHNASLGREETGGRTAAPIWLSYTRSLPQSFW